jgi:hypothetical protein
LFFTKEARVEVSIKLIIMSKEHPNGIYPHRHDLTSSFLIRQKASNAVSPYLINEKLSISPMSMMYINLSPMIAIVFELTTIKGSSVIAEITENESMAKI